MILLYTIVSGVSCGLLWPLTAITRRINLQPHKGPYGHDSFATMTTGALWVPAILYVLVGAAITFGAQHFEALVAVTVVFVALYAGAVAAILIGPPEPGADE